MFAIMGIAGNVGGAVSNTLPSIERRFGAYFGCLTTSPRQTDEMTAALVFLHPVDVRTGLLLGNILLASCPPSAPGR